MIQSLGYNDLGMASNFNMKQPCVLVIKKCQLS